MKRKDRKDKWLIGICVGILADSIMVAIWAPLFYILEPGAPYIYMGAGPFSLLVIVPTFIYAVVLACIRTRRFKLKIAAVILNLTPTLVMVLIVKLLAIMGHMMV